MPGRALAARLAYRLVTKAPASAVGRARVAGRLAPLLELGFAAAGAPLYATVVPVAGGPAAGLRLHGERRSLAWLSGHLEAEVQSALAGCLPTGGVFVDAGASIGFFTLLAARIAGPGGRIFAFEPQPAAAASIRRNAALNAFDNVTVVEAALGSSPGRVRLRGVGDATARVMRGGRDDAGLEVDCTSLDHFLGERRERSPDLVKIDVEGHELEVLAGMRATLAAARCAVVVECHGTQDEVWRALEAARYAVSFLGRAGSAPATCRSAHILALPETR